MSEQDENLEYNLLEHQRSSNFEHSLRSFQTQKVKALTGRLA